MEAMPKNKSEEIKLPDFWESMKLWANSFRGSNSPKTSTLEKGVKRLEEEQRRVRQEHSGGTVGESNRVVDRVKVEGIEHEKVSKGKTQKGREIGE